MNQFVEVTKKWYVNRTQVADVWINNNTPDNQWRLYISYIVPNKTNDSLNCGADEESAKKFLEQLVDRLNGKTTYSIAEDDEDGTD